jgi:hypothetical protein
LKKLLLLMALTMLGGLLFASVALAQDPCPDPNYPRQTPDGCQASDLPDVVVPTPITGPTTASATSSPTASSEATACGAPGPEDAALSGEARLQREMDIRAGKIDVCSSASATASDTATATATASSTEASDSARTSASTPPSATPTATATASGTAPDSVAAAVGGSLPATGSNSLLVGMAALMLLAGAGVMSVAIVRRAS